MTPPNQLLPAEELGRAIFDSKDVKSAVNKGSIPPKVFLEKKGVNELSVDRLHYVSSLATAAAVQTGLRGRPCRGWAKLLQEAAAKNNREVHPDPIEPHQLHHAFIRLPFDPSLEPDKAFDIQYAHALELAMLAQWLQAPEGPAVPSSGS
ncbi:hypothetical protein [Bradyrhizobium sp. CCBAU 45321]|uniref:hypothetical protein n=1 Tax=Bradyrhizobium sp. CCBAU 45321 TaxID=1641878 RepID=UPI0023026E3B|nr:hypothetical protein [Bradyrhizobium sp. CCBAU 45321]